MTLRTTLVLLVLAGALGGLALMKRGTGEGGPVAPPPTLLGALDSSFDIVRFDLVHSRSREMSSHEARGDEWWMVEPIVDRSRPENVQYLIEVLTMNQIERVEDAPPIERLERLGLEPPLGRVTLHAKDGRAFGLRVGEVDPTGAYCFVMFDGGDDRALYRTGRNLRNALDPPLQEWRDDRFLVGDAAFLRRIELLRPDRPKVVFERTGTDWAMLEPRPFDAASSLVGNVLAGGLLRMKVWNFVVSHPTDEDLLRLQLDEEHATIVRLDFGQAAPLEARFGRIETEDAGAPRAAWDAVRRHVFAVEGRETLELLVEDAEAFRDPVVTRASIGTCRWLRMTRGDGEVAFELRYEPAASKFRFVAPFEADVDDGRNGALRPWFLALRELQALRPEPGVETDGFVDAEEFGGQERFDDVFAVPDGLVEMDIVDRSGVERRERIELVGPDGDTWLVRSSEHPDVAYVVESRLVEKVLGQDPRPFLPRQPLPTDLNRMKEVRVTFPDGRSLHMVRGTRGVQTRIWIDPSDPEADTAGLQAWLSQFVTDEAVAILGRDAEPADGFAAPRAVVEIVMTDDQYFGGRYVLELGARDPSEKEVVARSPTTDLGRRVLFRFKAAVLDELEALAR